MIKKFTTYNESVRDMMTPLSKERIEQITIDKLRKVFHPMNKYIPSEFNHIAELLDEPKKNLHVISSQDSGFDVISKYFTEIVKGSKCIEFDEVDGEKIGNGDVFVMCYPDKKLALWYNDKDNREFQYWIFSRPLYCPKVNESLENTSLRDQMTGKSDKIEEWKNTIDYLIEQLKEEFKVNVTYLPNTDNDNDYDTQFDSYTIFIYSWVLKQRIEKWFETNTNAILKDQRQLRDNKTMITVKYPKKKILESVKDMMTPKSEDDIKTLVKGYMDKIRTTLDTYPMKIWSETDKICKFLSEEKENLYFVPDESKYYKPLDEYFTSIISSEHPITKKVKSHEGTWYCYPSLNLAWWDNLLELEGWASAWVFTKHNFMNDPNYFKLEESLRDKMTPKSPEQYLSPNLLEIYTNSKEMGWDVSVKENKSTPTSPIYVEIKFKNFQVFIVEDYIKNNLPPMYTEFYITKSRDLLQHKFHSTMLGQYDIPNFSGALKDWDELKTKIDTMLSIPILNESVRDMMTPKKLDDETVKKMVRKTPRGMKLIFIIKNGLLNYFTKEEIRGITNDSSQGVWLLMDNGLIDKYFTKEEIPQLVESFPENLKLSYSIDYNYIQQLKNVIRENSNKGFLVGGLIEATKRKNYDAIKILSETPQIKSHIPQELLKRINTNIDSDTYEELKTYIINQSKITRIGPKGETIIKYLDIYGPLDESIKDLMTPKSEDVILSSLDNIGEYQKMKYGATYGILSLLKPILDKDIYMPTVMDELFSLACSYGNTNVIEYLLSLKKYNYTFTNYVDGFRRAVEHGQTDTVKLLLSIEPSIPVDAEHNWALRLAISNGQLELVKLLLSKGADIKELGFRWGGSTPNRTPVELMRDRGFNDLADYVEQYIQTNESVGNIRQMMKPKTKKEIKNALLSKRITYDTVNGILKDKSSKRLFTDEEMTKMLHSPNITNKQRLYLLNGHILDIKKYFNDKHIKRILSLIDEPQPWAFTTFTNNLGDIYTKEEIREKLSSLSPKELDETITRHKLQKYY